MSTYTLLCDVFRAQGLKCPERAAQKAAEEFDKAKRDERIAAMAGTIEEIAQATGLSIQRIKQIRREQYEQRRSVA